MSIDKMEEDNGFKLAKEKSKRYLTQTITDYAYDTALQVNKATQAKTLPPRLERVVADISHHDNADKMEYMCFNQRGDISTLNGSSLKLLDMLTYRASSVSSPEVDINMWLATAWTAIDRL